MDKDMAQRVVLSNAPLWRKHKEINTGPNAVHPPVPLSALYELVLADPPLSQDEERSVLVVSEEHCQMVLLSRHAGAAEIDAYDQLMKRQRDGAAYVLQEMEKVTDNYESPLYPYHCTLRTFSFEANSPSSAMNGRTLHSSTLKQAPVNVPKKTKATTSTTTSTNSNGAAAVRPKPSRKGKKNMSVASGSPPDDATKKSEKTLLTQRCWATRDPVISVIARFCATTSPSIVCEGQGSFDPLETRPCCIAIYSPQPGIFFGGIQERPLSATLPGDVQRRLVAQKRKITEITGSRAAQQRWVNLIAFIAVFTELGARDLLMFFLRKLRMAITQQPLGGSTQN
ncbi:hypothetical protein C8J57DRAFT_1472644 [Mycena rebaudengoi]|nr:hypothetical protein C8J57DRAFT_1472644 [Mycena rebaudengoi]